MRYAGTGRKDLPEGSRTTDRVFSIGIPEQWRGQSKLAEFGLIHYNFRGTLEEFLDYASETGFQCTELSIRDIWNEKEGQSLEAAKEQAQLVKEMLTSRGLRASAISAGNTFLLPDEEARRAQNRAAQAGVRVGSHRRHIHAPHRRWFAASGYSG